jgi:hypothetical protein
MRAFFILCFILAVQLLSAQSPVKVYFEKDNGKVHIYADNPMFCPVSLKLKVDKTNMLCEGGCPEIAVVPQKVVKHKLLTLTPEDTQKSTKFSYSYKWMLGNITKTEFDKNHVYYLPFEKGKEYPLSQGYNGAQSHRNENAIDFSMPEGSGITAARDGIVIKVVQHNWNSCAEERCKEFNNTVTVYHSDGTFADYAHIKQNGSLVKEGDAIKAGQLIAKSGNTGWSSGPHLHFMVYRYNENGIQSLETKFKTAGGGVYLKNGTRYLRNYD